jgi:hypothetical protein
MCQKGDELTLAPCAGFPKEGFQLRTYGSARNTEAFANRGEILATGQALGETRLGGRQEEQIAEKLLVGKRTILQIKNNDGRELLAWFRHAREKHIS